MENPEYPFGGQYFTVERPHIHAGPRNKSSFVELTLSLSYKLSLSQRDLESAGSEDTLVKALCRDTCQIRLRFAV